LENYRPGPDERRIIETILWSSVLGDRDKSYFLRKTEEVDYLEDNLNFISDFDIKKQKLLQAKLIFLLEENTEKGVSYYSIFPKEIAQEGAKKDLIEFYCEKISLTLPSILDNIRPKNAQRLFIYLAKKGGKLIEKEMNQFLDIYPVSELSQQYWILNNEDAYKDRFYFFPFIEKALTHVLEKWPARERLYRNVSSRNMYTFRRILESLKEKSKFPETKRELYDILIQKEEANLEKEGITYVKVDRYNPYNEELFDTMLFSLTNPLELGYDLLKIIYDMQIEKERNRTSYRDLPTELPRFLGFLLTSNTSEIQVSDINFVADIKKLIDYLRKDLSIPKVQLKDNRIIYNKEEIINWISTREPFQEVLRRKIFEEISKEPHPLVKIALALKGEVSKMALEKEVRQYFDSAVTEFIKACETKEIADLSSVFINLNYILEGKPLNIKKIRKWEKELYKRSAIDKYRIIIQKMKEKMSTEKDLKKFNDELVNLLKIITQNLDEWPYLFMTSKFLSIVNNLRNVFAAHKISFGKPTELEAFYAIQTTYLVLSTWQKLKPLIDKYELES
jgi:hypothetical protein